MHGWLITNKYFVSNNFIKIEELLFESAKKHNIELIKYNNIQVIDVLAKKNQCKPDFILFWDKDIKLANYLESEGIRIFNSADAIRICDDKSLTYLRLRDKGIRQPKTIFSPLIYFHDISEDEEILNFAENHLRYPFVFKECFGSFGEQVYLINDRLELKSRIKKCGTAQFIMQEFIKSSFGKDLRVYVVGDKVVGTMLRENKSGDFRANIELGANGYKYNASEFQKDMALNVVKEIGLDFAGVDILFGENDEPILCEVNSNAYFTGINKALGIKVEDYIFEHIIDNVYT